MRLRRRKSAAGFGTKSFFNCGEDQFFQTAISCLLAGIIFCFAASPSWAYDLRTRSSRIQMREAQSLVDQGDMVGAIAAYQKAVEVAPNNVEAVQDWPWPKKTSGFYQSPNPLAKSIGTQS